MSSINANRMILAVANVLMIYIRFLMEWISAEFKCTHSCHEQFGPCRISKGRLVQGQNPVSDLHKEPECPILEQGPRNGSAGEHQPTVECCSSISVTLIHSDYVVHENKLNDPYYVNMMLVLTFWMQTSHLNLLQQFQICDEILKKKKSCVWSCKREFLCFIVGHMTTVHTSPIIYCKSVSN